MIYWAHVRLTVLPYPVRGLDNEREQKIMVYDLGGGTFDVSIIEIGDGAASFKAACTGLAVRSTRSWVSSSNFALVRFLSKCFGPSEVRRCRRGRYPSSGRNPAVPVYRDPGRHCNTSDSRSWVSSSNFALVRFMSKCFGPSEVAVMKGRLMSGLRSGQ